MSQNKTKEGRESSEDILYALMKVEAHFIVINYCINYLYLIIGKW